MQLCPGACQKTRNPFTGGCGACPGPPGPTSPGFTGLKQNKVSNALKRGERRGWLRSARLGRVFKAVDRFVFSNAGIEEMGRQFGWEPLWWHTANGVRALARRLEVLELAYRYLPGFWQSNAVSRPIVWVYANMLADTDPGEPDRRKTATGRAELVSGRPARLPLAGKGSH